MNKNRLLVYGALVLALAGVGYFGFTKLRAQSCDTRPDFFTRTACEIEKQMPGWDVTDFGIERVSRQRLLFMAIVVNDKETDEEFARGLQLVLDAINAVPVSDYDNAMFVMASPRQGTPPLVTLAVLCAPVEELTLDNGGEHCASWNPMADLMEEDYVWPGRGNP